MGKVKNKNGISLIVLVITILVMIILAGVVIVTMSENNPINKAKEANFKEDAGSFQSELSLSIANSLALDPSLKTKNVSAITYEQIKKYINSFSKKYKDKFVIADSKLVYVGKDKNETKWVNDMQIPIFRGANAPKLSEGMIPVKYQNEKWVICEETDLEWFDYENKKWANVMLSDGKYKEATVGAVVEDADLGSMFVWIPRYAYSIAEYKTDKNAEGTTQNITNVSYLVGSGNVDLSGNIYEKDYDESKVIVGKSTPKIVHPVFENSGSATLGFWVAKFEASMAENNDNTSVNNNVSNKTIKVLPGKNTWRYIDFTNAFITSYNMLKENNVYGVKNASSHLIKNTEWGAVTYLAASQYGITPRTNTSASKITEGNFNIIAGSDNYKINGTQSTTGNTTGIYDMNGGGWDYVAAYFNNENSILSENARAEIFPNNKLNPKYKSVIDEYQVSEDEIKSNTDGIWGQDIEANARRLEITKARLELMKKNKGDAMQEFILADRISYYGKIAGGKYAWIRDLTGNNTELGSTVCNGDQVLIGHNKITFILRGGFWWSGSPGGIFANYGSHGVSGYGEGFRPVIVNN